MSDDIRMPLPVTDDPDTSGFFAAATRNVLAVCVCADCGHHLHLPTAYCHACGGWNPTWRETSGTGVLHSWTVVEHQVHPAFPTPYTLVLVEVDDAPGVRLIGHLKGRPVLHPQQPMIATFEPLRNGTVLPQWQPAAP